MSTRSRRPRARACSRWIRPSPGRRWERARRRSSTSCRSLVPRRVTPSSTSSLRCSSRRLPTGSRRRRALFSPPPSRRRLQRAHGALRDARLEDDPELVRARHDRQGDPAGDSVVHGSADSRPHHQGQGRPSLDGGRSRSGREGDHGRGEGNELRPVRSPCGLSYTPADHCKTEVNAPRKEHLMSMDQNEMHPRPNIVLVHGAWADGSSWSSVIERLQADGYHVTAPQFPLTSLADDVARLRHVLALQDGPTVIAGHSYGGQVMTALGDRRPQRRRSGLHRGVRDRRRRIARGAASAGTSDPGTGPPVRR